MGLKVIKEGNQELTTVSPDTTIGQLIDYVNSMDASIVMVSFPDAAGIPIVGVVVTYGEQSTQELNEWADTKLDRVPNTVYDC